MISGVLVTAAGVEYKFGPSRVNPPLDCSTTGPTAVAAFEANVPCFTRNAGGVPIQSGTANLAVSVGVNVTMNGATKVGDIASFGTIDPVTGEPLVFLGNGERPKKDS